MRAATPWTTPGTSSIPTASTAAVVVSSSTGASTTAAGPRCSRAGRPLSTRRMLDDIGLFDELLPLRRRRRAGLRARGRLGLRVGPTRDRVPPLLPGAGAYSASRPSSSGPRPRPLRLFRSRSSSWAGLRPSGSRCRPGAPCGRGARGGWPQSVDGPVAVIALRAGVGPPRAAVDPPQRWRQRSRRRLRAEFRRLLDEFRLRARDAALRNERTRSPQRPSRA